jgi:hypothetical protein
MPFAAECPNWDSMPGHLASELKKNKKPSYLTSMGCRWVQCVLKGAVLFGWCMMGKREPPALFRIRYWLVFWAG